MPNISTLSRMIGLGPRFHSSLVHLLELGYKCRVRMPLFIGASFVICHFFANYIPRVDLQIEEIGFDDEEEEEDDEDSDLDSTIEYEVGDSDGELVGFAEESV